MANKKWPHLFQDRHSNRLLAQANQLGFNTQRIQMKDYELFCYGARTAANIDYARRFIQANPNATIVNMGCGLDDLFQDIDNGQIHYYNVDFPEVIQTREQLIPSHERVFHIASSLTDYEWLQQIKHDSNNGILFLAAGVMYYLTVEEGRGLIQTIAETFTNGQFLFDSESPWAMKQSNKHVKKQQMNGAEMHFMLDDPNVIQSWSKHIHQFNVYYDFTHFLKGAKIPFKYKPFFWFMKTIKAMYFVALTF
ncbi:MAG: class I SAM-dependent methyltransferase [Alcaligenaceae bacterium]|nr:class I SAM-dependent methyltransferase [Alcaligenaceae bacterium]